MTPARLPWVSSSFPPGLPQLFGSPAVGPCGRSFREVRARFRFVAVAFGAPFASSSSGHSLVSRLRLVASRPGLPWVSPREKKPDTGFSRSVPPHFSASVRLSFRCYILVACVHASSFFPLFADCGLLFVSSNFDSFEGRGFVTGRFLLADWRRLHFGIPDPRGLVVPRSISQGTRQRLSQGFASARGIPLASRD